MIRCSLVLVFAACTATVPPPTPTTAASITGDVEVGTLAKFATRLRVVVLVPAGGDLTAAVERARATARAEGLALVDALPIDASQPTATVELVSLEHEDWRSHTHGGGYVSTMASQAELEQMHHAVGAVEIRTIGAATHGWDIVRASMRTANDLAQSIHGWVYTSSRVFDVASLAETVAAIERHDVHGFVRVMKVVEQSGPAHVRSIGLAAFGMPELYVPDIPETLLDGAEDVVLATAQQLIDRGGVTRRGAIDVGTLTWHARWIHDPKNPSIIEIELTR
jgi:hypothetical protein